MHTIPNVEICSVGLEWAASTGPCTITFQHIADAVIAANDDPLIQPPRGRLGHTSDLNDGQPRFSPFAAIGDAEPAFGVYTNLRAENDGAILVGDAVDVPDWITPGTYPNRSMECDWDITTPGGKRYSMVVTAVSWLGVHFPAVQDLADLTTLIADGPDGLIAATSVASRQELPMPQEPTAPTSASVSTSTVRERFNFEWTTSDDNDSDLNTYWWWARDIRIDPEEVIADDDEGGLWAVPYTTDGEDAVTFGEPVKVRETYVPVAAAAASMTSTAPDSQRVLASFSRPVKPAPSPVAASRPDPATNERTPMDDAVRQALATANGLDPATATEAEVNAAVLAAATASTPASDDATPVESTPMATPGASVAPVPAPGQPTTPVTPPDPAPVTPVPVPATPVTPEPAPPTPTSIPAGTTEPEKVPALASAAAVTPDAVPVSREVWEETQARLGTLEAEKTQRDQAATAARRDALADGWVRSGRITPHERALARTNLEINEKATTEAYNALAAGRTPVADITPAPAAASTADDLLYALSRSRMGAPPLTTPKGV